MEKLISRRETPFFEKRIPVRQPRAFQDLNHTRAVGRSFSQNFAKTNAMHNTVDGEAGCRQQKDAGLSPTSVL